MRDAPHESLMPLVDWVEVHNARLVGNGNERAAIAARDHDRPGVAVSDAHTVLEVAVAYTALDGDPVDARGLARGAAHSRAHPRPGELHRAPVDTAGQGHPTRPGQRSEPARGGGMSEPRAGPSTDGRWDRRDRSVELDGGYPGDRSCARLSSAVPPRRRDRLRLLATVHRRIPIPRPCRFRDGCDSPGRSSRSPSRS